MLFLTFASFQALPNQYILFFDATRQEVETWAKTAVGGEFHSIYEEPNLHVRTRSCARVIFRDTLTEDLEFYREFCDS